MRGRGHVDKGRRRSGHWSAVQLSDGFPRLERWLDGTCDAARDVVLEFEDIIERTVETVGPDVGTARRVDKLAGDAHAVAGFANRTFEHVTHAQLALDLLHIYGPSFVCKARITDRN